jgi:hypothetical protein
MEDKTLTITETEFKRICDNTANEIAKETNEFAIGLLAIKAFADLGAKLFSDNKQTSESESQCQ